MLTNTAHGFTRLRTLASGTAAAAVVGCLLAAIGLTGCRFKPAPPAVAPAPAVLAIFPGRAPSPRFDARGALHVTYVAGEAGVQRVVDRVIDGAAPQPVAISPAGAAVDARGENGPTLAVLPEGTLLVVYSAFGPHGSLLEDQVSQDGGRTWSAPRTIEDDTAPRSHGFADVTATRVGAVVSWLDNRSGSQGVQTAVLHADGMPAPTRTADPKTCQCCRTAVHAAADGTVWLAYRDLAPGKIRNMAYAVSRDAGKTFTLRGDVADDGWVLDGCPESGPRFAETADGAVWLAWFNGKTNAIEVAAVRAGGAFERPVAVARADALTRTVNHPEIGTLPDGRLAVFYEAFRGGARAVDARVSDTAHRHWSAPIPIAEAGVAPRFARSGDRLRLTYTSSVTAAAEVHVVDPRARLLQP